MGSFLENIIKNAGLGSILGGAAGQSEGSEGGSPSFSDTLGQNLEMRANARRYGTGEDKRAQRT